MRIYIVEYKPRFFSSWIKSSRIFIYNACTHLHTLLISEFRERPLRGGGTLNQLSLLQRIDGRRICYDGVRGGQEWQGGPKMQNGLVLLADTRVSEHKFGVVCGQLCERVFHTCMFAREAKEGFFHICIYMHAGESFAADEKSLLRIFY